MRNFKYLILAFVLLFNGVSYADPLINSSFSSWVNSLHLFLNTLYLIIRPLLIIWWKFLSNSFVYWSAFGIDNILWKLWQLVRTFMNYAIWFIFIFSIFVYFFKWDSKYSWKKLLPKIVIASVIVNISWFLIAVLLDLSTIFTVAAGNIWWIFTNLISKTDHNIKKQVLQVPIVMDMDKWFKNFIWIKNPEWTGLIYQCIYKTWWKIWNPPCLSNKYGKFVILWKNWTIDKKLNDKIKKIWITTKDIDYSTVWMLFSLFRYINTAFLTDNTNSLSQVAVLSIVKIILLLVLIIPFIVLSIIFVIRVVILRVVIPMSPIILWSFILWIWDSQIKWKLKDIISIIFQPAYVVFMLSIWFVFIQSVYTMIPSPKKQNDNSILNKLQITQTKNKNAINIWDLAYIYVKSSKDSWQTSNEFDPKNVLAYFTWIIANLLSATVMWMLVFIALKSNSFTKKISSIVDTYAQKVITTTPIIWWQSIDSTRQIISWLHQIPDWQRQHQMQEQDKIKDLFKKNDKK